MKLPRKLKKDIKGCKVIMDVASIPNEMEFRTWVAVFSTTGVVLWDSCQRGQKPQVLSLRTKRKIKIKDLKGI